MAGRGRNSDVVTIIYPPGCREVSEDLGNDELIRRLKSLAHTFQAFGQAEDDTKYTEYSPLALHLAEDHYLNHQSRDVQLLVACCIADILRIFAPEAPYRDQAQIKTIFYFLIKQLGGLKDPKDPAFKRYFYLLENLAYVKSFNMCFDLEDFNEIFCALFGLMFKIVNDEHSGKVKTFMLDVLCPLITEADYVSNELLDIILINIVDPYKTQRKNAFALAKELVSKTSDTLEPYLQQFFNQVLILGKAESELSIARKVYDLIYELYNISPGILLSILPQLEFKLKSTEESERMGSVSLLARMFSERGSTLATTHRPLWSAFLGRYNDISVAIRIKCVQYTMHFLLNHPELQDNIVETLKARQHDSEENVRYEVVMAIVATAKKDFDIVAKSEQLLNFVKERTLDKKFKIRKEAMSGLAMIYRKHLSDPHSTHEATKNAIIWIKDKILHGYYMSGIEDRLLVERLLNMYLVPFNLESSERMKKLFMLFATVDDNAGKAFIEIQKHQLHVRRAMSDLLQLYRQPKNEKRDKDIQVKVHGISKFLPEPMKAQEFLKKLSVQLGTDNVLLNCFEKVVDPDVSCKECQLYVNQILKKMGSPIMTNLYYGTVKQILERVSSVMIDREAIQYLVGYVMEALKHGEILNELGLEIGLAGERGLRLLFVLSFIFPSHFLHEDIVKQLISMLSIEGDYVGPQVLSALTYVGRKAPLGTAHPELLDQLVDICKNFIRDGTPKQAKHAVKCLHMNTTDTQENVFLDILDMVKTTLNGPRSDAYLTAIVSLGHISYYLPEKYPVHIKNLVSRNIVKQLLMKEVEENHTSEESWVDFEELALETRCKVEAMKMIARWLVGLKDDTISAQKTFRMLNAHITSKGDLHEGGKLSTAESSWLRLAAGCAMLKICEQKGVGDVYTVEQFYNLSQLAVDDVKQVRELFVAKLHKGLAKGVPFKCLPLDFMGFYALCGLETDKKLKDMAKRYVLSDITKRRECIKALSFAGGENADQLPNIMPDYMLCFAVVILAHLPLYETNKDVQVLEKLKSALWFILEPLMMKNENFSLQFYKMLLEMMKSHIDATEPPSDILNHKMWALCDLSLTIIMSKATSYNDFNKEFPFRPTVPPLYYKPHPEGSKFENPTTYIPAEMALLPKSKIGVSVGWQTKRGRRKSNEDTKAVVQDSIDSAVSNEENGNHVQDEAPSTRKRATRTSEENTCISDNGENETSNDKNDDIPPPDKNISPSELTSSTNEEPLAETAAGGRPKRTRR